jgi:hypothetical protein
MTWLAPSPNWRLLTVSDPAYDGIRYAAIAPGCTNRPHDGTQCGCRMFLDHGEGDRYIRSKMS